MVANALGKGQEEVEKRFQDDWRIVRILDALEAMQREEYESAQDCLLPLLGEWHLADQQKMEGAQKGVFLEQTRLEYDWSHRYDLFLMLVYHDLSKHLQHLNVGVKARIPHELVEFELDFGRETLRNFPGRYGEGVLERRCEKYELAPLVHRFELFEFVVWDAVDDFVLELLNATSNPSVGPGDVERSCLSAMKLHCLQTSSDELYEGRREWEIGDCRVLTRLDPHSKAGPASASASGLEATVDHWRFLHPLNRCVFHWLLSAVVDLLTERNGEGSDRVVNFLNMMGEALGMEENSNSTSVLDELERLKQRAWQEVRHGLRLRNGSISGELSVLFELAPSFKEHPSSEGIFKFESKALDFCSSNVSREALKMHRVFPEILCENPVETSMASSLVMLEDMKDYTQDVTGHAPLIFLSMRLLPLKW
uniref:Uncharacterized protein n=1 Tax=Chromera velia CCMP2878 TaxID=1169474 RepID=A0A0G4H1J7_9ALVE|eukprot:Cvel_24279.t1-p1 / transcript=Cvel_24279.t1 / gene=Cvel_24279 / organism=Chromera_velia_CCMP2878 / gene_product=hypothetical protein / transcript_product=hypothetical protein / location=Cvel_scaffold2604:18853-20121(-) / protein_length=423 / sequence_SO=supercontig / SO=protein_coding / is_pseudo=false